MKESAKAHYDQNRELILASKQAQYQANQKAKRDISRINSGVPRCFQRGGANQTEGRHGGGALTNQLGMQKFILQFIEQIN